MITNPIRRLVITAGTFFALSALRLFAQQAPAATGGAVSYSNGYTVHTFTSSGTFVINRSITAADLVIVAGGGGGGHQHAGGGGAGGVLPVNGIGLGAGSYSIVVGAGGAGGLTYPYTGINGANSSAVGYSAIGGGAGTGMDRAGNDGGSGGADGYPSGGVRGGNGVAGQGNAGNRSTTASGLYGGGGGGAGSQGSGIVGGAPLTTWAGTYGGGGGGGFAQGGNGGGAGAGNGGEGATDGSAAIPNTGSGGGGGGNMDHSGGSGGSGIVVIRYRNAPTVSWAVLPPTPLTQGTWFPVRATGRDLDGDLGGVWVEVSVNGGAWQGLAYDPAGVNGGDGFATTSNQNGVTADVPGTTYQFRSYAYDQAGANSGWQLSNIYAVASTASIRINAGGPAYVDGNGNTWSADNGYSGGTAFTESSTVVVTGTPDPTLFKTLRYDSASALPDMIYTLAAPNGQYTVRLYFAETSGSVNTSGQRVFDVDIQGQRALEDVDILMQAGGKYKPLITSSSTTVTNGQLVIRFIPQVNLTRVNAIAIIPAAASDTQAPSAPGGLTFTNNTASSVRVNWGASTDNTGVAGYRIARGSSVIGTTTGMYFDDTGLTGNTAYSYSVVAFDAAGNVSTATAASVTTVAAASFTPIRINAGGASYTDTANNVWAADAGYNTGKTYTTTITVTGTADPSLFKTERWDDPTGAELAYNFTVPNGTYTVRLYFAETYASTQGAGLRVFDVNLQSVRAFEDVDIYSLAGGGNKALVLSKVVTVSSGALSIQFLHQIENPKVNAIEIVSTTSSDAQAPTMPASISVSNVATSSLTLQWGASTDNVGVTGYAVSRNNVPLQTVSGLTFNDSGLTAATSYQYSVKALDAAGNASAPATLTVTTASAADTQAPSAPTGLTATGIDSAGFILAWSSSSDNVGVVAYQVRRDSVTLSPDAQTTSMQVSGLAASQTYMMTVRASDAAGNWSNWSTSLGVTTTAANPNDSDGDGIPNAVEALLGTNASSKGTNDTTNATLKLKINKP